MTFQCAGTPYCLDSNTAIVSLSFSDKETEILRFENAPICVLIDDNEASQSKCYRFAGIDIFGINSFEVFLCGVNPSYVLFSGGLTPAFNGSIVFSNGSYRYKPGTESINQVTQIIRDPSVYLSDGDCSQCLVESGNMKVTITDKNNNKLFEKTGLNPQIKASCDGCPPNTCKCLSPGYPGYCCLDCSAIASSIRSVTNELRIKNG